MTDLSEIYRQMHERRMDVVEERRRASDYHARLASVLPLVREHAHRYSRGSVTRVALDNLALEMIERGVVEDPGEE